jgi:wyosine [tRNA(Phe)-imidazoG37] synthetase (radical SAM superfamily)
MARALSFTDHGRDLDQNRYVYAVVSRRARGLSVGVNLNPDKVCNFDCPYCQVDRTVPGGSGVVEVPALAAELDDLLARVAAGTLWTHPLFQTTPPEMQRVVDVAFAGDGEPTTPKEFPAAAGAARDVIDRSGFCVPLRLLTNATRFDRPQVRAALASFDELWCKLDAGTEPYFRRVDGTRLPFRRILDNLLAVARERPIVIQAMFVALDGTAPEDAEIDAWAGRLRDIGAQGGRIDRVQVYTVARPPAAAAVGPLSDARLARIADRARAEGLAVEVYGAAGTGTGAEVSARDRAR